MIAAGFTAFISNLSWANAALLATIGQLFDLMPLVLYLQVFLSYPSGRLEGTAKRVLVLAAYVIATIPQLLMAILGGLGQENLFAAADARHAVQVILHLQLSALSALALGGVVLLVLRRARERVPRRRAATVLVDCFALGLVMTALLLVAGQFQWSSFETIRRVTFVTIGLAPIAFLFGLLSARLGARRRREPVGRAAT